ncbi:MAG TPA: histidine phosphatase family protein [Rhizomicrobium sp.]|jgi:probable phosphoglycerate mutase
MTDLQHLTLYVVRHGQTEDNVARRWTGRNDSHLTDLGRAKARASGALLARIANPSALDFIASPLHRACVTMELLQEGAGVPPCRYRTDRRLMENDCGDFHGLLEDDIRNHHGEHHARLLEDEWNWRAPGGQSQAQQHDDIGRFLSTLTRDSVIVCHGLTIRLMRAPLLGLSPRETLAHSFLEDGVLRFAGGKETYFPVNL